MLLTDNRSPTPFQRAKMRLRALGIELISTPGAYRFRYTRLGRAAALLPETTDDLGEALRIGCELAKNIPPVLLPPLGPMGRGKTRQSVMYRHNQKVAAKRRHKVKSQVKRRTGKSDKTA